MRPCLRVEGATISLYIFTNVLNTLSTEYVGEMMANHYYMSGVTMMKKPRGSIFVEFNLKKLSLRSLVKLEIQIQFQRLKRR